jgi:methionyl-tRNA formyltransferase
MKQKLKSVLLTTDTPHHRYFAGMTSALFPWQAILVETRKISPPFELNHPFEKKRDEYEKKVLLKGNDQSFSEVSDTYLYDSVNSKDAISKLNALSPDIIMVFGTGKLHPAVIETANIACFNLHGGNPEHYRGLDTHLWAIYHRDFNNLVTSLHFVNDTLDAGEIIFQAQLPLTKKSKIFQLRSINTQICVELSNLASFALNNHQVLPRRKQIASGRYYSYMPSVLKEDCVKKFEGYVSGL